MPDNDMVKFYGEWEGLRVRRMTDNPAPRHAMTNDREGAENEKPKSVPVAPVAVVGASPTPSHFDVLMADNEVYPQWLSPDEAHMCRLCRHCTLTFGAHRSGSDTCPGHEGRMDWSDGPGTTFEWNGLYQRVPAGTRGNGARGNG